MWIRWRKTLKKAFEKNKTKFLFKTTKFIDNELSHSAIV